MSWNFATVIFDESIILKEAAVSFIGLDEGSAWSYWPGTDGALTRYRFYPLGGDEMGGSR